ncbi:MAG: hypothetical protein M5U14_09720 [Acidimicrobiia bacterium]|nr:hypothetical protein [Acidimicrobiia bacterium]
MRAEDRADLDAAVAAVRDEVARDALDLNPRTRAQVRGLEMVLRLLDAGDEGAALDLLDGELSRSFTGRADLSVAERHPGPTGR